MKVQNKKAYNELAGKYLQLRKEETSVKFYKELLETPYLFKMVGDVKGKKILDLGCGPGFHANLLFKKGAKVTGIDNSEESINHAKKESPESKFFIGDIEKLPFPSASFDIVFSAMVIGHMTKWDKIFYEVKRVLKKGGIFVFSNYNPFKEVIIKKEWKGREFNVIENYFDEREIYGQWKDGEKSFTVSHHHKTYGTIIKIILKNGFEILDYEDCKPPKSAKKIYPKKYEETINVPNFSVWKVRKR
jgi:ubiquinone/menaquinone biosynthesis C-methylase UbiE